MEFSELLTYRVALQKMTSVSLGALPITAHSHPNHISLFSSVALIWILILLIYLIILMFTFNNWNFVDSFLTILFTSLIPLIDWQFWYIHFLLFALRRTWNSLHRGFYQVFQFFIWQFRMNISKSINWNGWLLNM